MLDWYGEIKNFSKIIDCNLETLKNIWSGTLLLENVYTDSKDRSNARFANLAQKHNLLDTGYINFDKKGFRVYNKNNLEKKIFCYGCSNTFGMGIKDEETWPFKLGLLLNATPSNYGILGASIDKITWTIYNSLSQAHRENTVPDSFYVLFPDIFRSEYFNEAECDNNKFKSLTFSYGEDIDYEFSSQFNVILNRSLLEAAKNNIHHVHFSQLTILNCIMSFIKNFKFIETIASLYNIKWFWSTWDPIFLSLREQTIYDLLNNKTFISDKNRDILIKMFNNKASDNIHIGSNYCDFISKQFSIMRNMI